MKSMKKILCIALALIMIIGLVGCATTTEPAPTHTKEIPTQEAQPTTTENSEAPETEESYVFLVYNSEGGSPVKANGFGGVWEYGIYTPSTSIISEDARKTFVNPLSGEEFDYIDSRGIYKVGKDGEFASYYGIYDKYIKDRESFEILRGTDLIVYYDNIHSVKESEKVPLSSEDAKKIADEFLKTILPEGIFEKHEKGSPVGGGYYSFPFIVYYKRPLHGYDTEETLCVYIGKDGKVQGYNGKALCKLDHCRDNVTKEQIDTARDTLLEKLKSLNLENLRVDSTSLVVNTEGKLFLQIAYQYSHEDGGRAEIALINVI